MNDEEVVRQIQRQLVLNLAKQRRISEQIESLARQRINLEERERQLRRKLREVWTEPLNLTSDD